MSQRNHRHGFRRDSGAPGAAARAAAWARAGALAITPLALAMVLVPGALPPALVLALTAVAGLVAWPASGPAVGGPELERLRSLAANQARQLEAQARMRRALRSAPTSRALARGALRVLGEACAARAGRFYLMRGGQELELAAQVGDDWPDGPEAIQQLGHGLAGRAAATRRRLVEPATAAGIAVAVPYHLVGRVKGVAVLLLPPGPAERALEFLADTAEPIAAALDARRSRERVQLLLAETRRHAAAYATQQRELQRTNARLQRSDRYKNEFLANMTHELRSPLNSMLLLSQVLAENRRGRLGPEDVDAAQVINKAGRELLVIIDDILDLMKAEAGRLEIHPETVRVSDLAESLAALYRPLAGRRGLDLQVTVADDAPADCVTDSTRLSQILKNLLNNALKFTESGSVSLRIAAAPRAPGDAEALDFIVRDTGIGISPEVLPALFAPFTQGDGSISRRFGGSGLGLSICRKLAQLLGARIEVASEPGRGSTFTLRLPRAIAALPGGAAPTGSPVVVAGRAWSAPAAPAPAEAAPAAGTEPASGAAAGLLAGRSVLVVDGDMRSAFRLSAMLESAGACVNVARDASAALAMLDAEPAPAVALVRPGALIALADDGQRQWWEVALGATRTALLAASVPASGLVPSSVPVLAPDLPAERFCLALARLAASPRRAAEAVPC